MKMAHVHPTPQPLLPHFTPDFPPAQAHPGLRRLALQRLLGGACALAALGLAGCASTPLPPAGPQAGPADDPATDGIGRQDVAMMALGLVGTPYRFGGNTPQGGFDCSGLIAYVFNHAAGLGAPRTVRQLQDWGEPVEPAQVHTGDLAFFGRGAVATHAGIVVSRRRFVHAPSTGGTVRLDHLTAAYWTNNFRQFRRV